MRKALVSLALAWVLGFWGLLPCDCGQAQQTKVLLQVIQVDTKEEAQGVVGSLREGKGFDELASELAPEGLKGKKGYLGDVELGKLLPPFREKLGAVETGKTSEPIPGEGGWFIFRVLSKEDASRYEAMEESPQFHLERGLVLGEMGDEEGEIQAYRTAIALDNGLPEAHANLGEALRRKAMRALQGSGPGRRELPPWAMELLDEAIDELKAAIALNGDLWEAHFNLGLAYAAQGLLGLTILEFREALRIRGDSGDLHRAIAQALILEGRLEEARGHLQKAAELGAEVEGLKTELERRSQGRKGK